MKTAIRTLWVLFFLSALSPKIYALAASNVNTGEVYTSLTQAFSSISNGAYLKLYPSNFQGSLYLTNLTNVTIDALSGSSSLSLVSNFIISNCSNVNIRSITFSGPRILSVQSSCVKIQSCVFSSNSRALLITNSKVQLVSNVFLSCSNAVDAADSVLLLQRSFFQNCMLPLFQKNTQSEIIHTSFLSNVKDIETEGGSLQLKNSLFTGAVPYFSNTPVVILGNLFPPAMSSVPVSNTADAAVFENINYATHYSSSPAVDAGVEILNETYFGYAPDCGWIESAYSNDRQPPELKLQSSDHWPVSPSNIIFSISDKRSGVDLQSLYLSIAGRVYFSNGIAASNVQYTFSGTSSNKQITLLNPGPFLPESLAGIKISCQDYFGNSHEEILAAQILNSWNDTNSPQIQLISPSAQSRMFLPAEVVFEITDVQSTVNLQSIAVELDGEIFSNWTTEIIASGFRLRAVLNLAEKAGTAIIHITAADAAANSAEFWTWLTLDKLSPDFSGELAIFNSPVNINSQAQLAFRPAKNGKVKIDILNLTGKSVKIIYNDIAQAETDLLLNWNLDDENGDKVSAGLYIMRVETDEGIKTLNLAVEE